MSKASAVVFQLYITIGFIMYHGLLWIAEIKPLPKYFVEGAVILIVIQVVLRRLYYLTDDVPPEVRVDQIFRGDR